MKTMKTQTLLIEMENSAEELENVRTLITLLMNQLCTKPMPNPSDPFDGEYYWEQWKADYCAAFDVVKDRISDIGRSLQQTAQSYCVEHGGPEG